MKISYYLLVILLLISHQSIGQFTNDTTSNTIVRDSLGTDQLTPLLATTSTGHTYISWFDFSDGNFQLRMQLLDALGNKLWQEAGLVVSSFPQSTALYRYDLKVDNNDNAIVAFQDIRSGDLKVVVSKVDMAGSLVWGAAGVALLDSTAQGIGPTICVTQNNDVIVAWTADVGSSKWISFQKITSAGTILWSNRIFDSSNANKYSRAVMVPYDADDFTMLYVQEVGSFPGATSTIFAQHYDMNGNPVWTLPVQVSTKTIAFFTFPQIISDENNGFFFAFNTSNPISTSLNDVYAQHVDSLGNLWSATGTEVANSTTEHKSTGGFCYNRTNNQYYVCIQILDGGQSNSGVSIQGLDSAGNVLFGPNAIALKNIDPIYYNPHALVDAGDGLITVYSFGSFGAQQIAAIKTDYAGSTTWGYDPNICNYSSNKDDLSAGIFKNDQTVIVWMDDRLDAGIYTQNLTGDGIFGVITNVNEIKNQSAIELYPNPSSSATIKYSSKANQKVILTITDATGRLCSKKEYSVNIGLNKIQIEENHLSQGLYQINISSQENVSNVKWLKQ